jgi:catechol 2,3-dioxygenase-like lactoylglutathione lyase family enzyme
MQPVVIASRSALPALPRGCTVIPRVGMRCGASRDCDVALRLHPWGHEVRAFLRDPDGHLIELSQTD